MRRKTSSAGYSLTEMLVILAIVGIIALVSIPNFINLRHSALLKTSLRTFSSDLRSARQLSVTRYRRVKIQFENNTRSYQMRMFNPTTSTWDAIANVPDKTLAETTSFTGSTNVSDRDLPTDGKLDLIFEPNGTLLLDTGNFESRVVITSQSTQLPKNNYIIRVSAAGLVSSI
jgi:type IV fimbrial biogenesis protein FimT